MNDKVKDVAPVPTEGDPEDKKFMSFSPMSFQTIFYGPDGSEFLVLDAMNGMVLKGGEPVPDTQGVYWAFCEWMGRNGVKLPATAFIDIIDRQAQALLNESDLVKRLMAENQVLKETIVKGQVPAPNKDKVKELSKIPSDKDQKH